MLFFSAYLENNYNIKATIMPEIIYNAVSGNESLSSLVNFLSDSLVLVIVCLISLLVL